MFLFYHSEQNESNKNFYKGTLFEKLLNEYLIKLGYKIQIRIKHNSLEYDIEGIHIPTSQRMLGEAKAFDKNIAGQILSSFVGKVLPLGLLTKDIKGLFLSTSPLTAEAEDYYRTVKDLGINVITGKSLYQSIIDVFKYPNSENIKDFILKKDFIVQAEYILATDNGNFLVYVSGNSLSVAPTYLTLYNETGHVITDINFIQKLITNIQEFNSLKPLTFNYENKPKTVRHINSGLIVGTSWIDYRLPAGPDFFIGREELINQLINSIIHPDNSNIFQIKSRSGVGKSSTLSMISTKLEQIGIITELHDSRDIKSVLDLRSIIKRFTGSENVPQDMREIEDNLFDFSKKLSSKKAVFMVDQFESTFINEDIFNAYESIANIFLKFKNNLFFCIARKNDQLTTYDETKITLNRLNEISRSYVLQDFSSNEAAILIRKINETSPVVVGQDILLYVLEFAQGFPWLLKRTMAHIVKLVTQLNIPQNELFAVGLKLDDLFDEELDGLDEIEKEYLFRIASKLPSDFHQLQRSFDEDPILPKVLDKLTQMRLLRMTGVTYDTYNDVFKEYLVYKRLPEFKQAIIYRSYPNSVINSYLSIIKYESFTNEDLEKYLELGRGSVFNSIREWRNIGLIEKNGDIWSIPKKVNDLYSKNLLGEYIRRQLLENDVITKLLARISTSNFLEDSLPDFLIEQFPFVEATKQTWQLYSNVLKSWLIGTKIIKIDSKGILQQLTINRETLINELGNLERLKTGRRKSADLFLPTVSWQYIEELIDDLLAGIIPNKGEKLKALKDLKNGGWYIDNSLVFSSKEEVLENIKETLSEEPYVTIWNSTKTNSPLFPIMREILSSDNTEETIKWRLKKILNWGKSLCFIKDKRYKY